MSDSLWPHESQHARTRCASPTPRVHSNSCPSSRWCYPAISSSVIPFSSCLQCFPASETSPVSRSRNAGDVRDAGVWFLGREDPLEEGMATHSSILAWRIPMDREAWWAAYSPWGRRAGHDWSNYAPLIECLSVCLAQRKAVSTHYFSESSRSWHIGYLTNHCWKT